MSPALRTTLAVVRLAGQGVRRRPLSTVLTVLAVALGVGLVVAVSTLHASTNRSFEDAAHGYDVILGPAHGSSLTVFLSTLFHADAPAGTLPWSVYREARRDPRVRYAVPYAMGDTFRGHRVVGTSFDLFDVLQGADGRPLREGMRGRIFRPRSFDAVVGSAVARATGLTLGRTFRVSHGLKESTHFHDDEWTVVGVLRPTGTAHDRAIYIHIRTFYAIAGHGAAPKEDDDDEHEHGHADEPASLSAVGIRLKSPTLRLGYFHEFRTTRTDAQAVLPMDQARRLEVIVGDVKKGVGVIAWLVTAVAALGILVGLYEAIHGRRREIALLRAVGARPRHVFAVILLEAVLLCVLGGLAGLLLGHGGLAVAAPALLEDYGIRIAGGPGWTDLRILLLVAALGLLAGLLPAWRGLATPVAENLEPGA